MGNVKVVDGADIAIPESSMQYCMKGLVEDDIPFIACAPNKDLCERSYVTAKKMGSMADLKVVAECALTTVRVN
jgi:hypothetical protein